MDQRTAATIDGFTAVLSDLVKLLIAKQLLSIDEVRTTLSDVLVKEIERGAQPGFDEVPIHLLRKLDVRTIRQHSGAPRYRAK